jgi:hypothetical protein
MMSRIQVKPQAMLTEFGEFSRKMLEGSQRLLSTTAQDVEISATPKGGSA